VAVTFHASGGDGEHVAIVPAGGVVATDAVADQPIDGASDGTLAFPTEGWAAGDYEAVLVGPDAELSRIPFWVQAAGEGPHVGTTQTAYRVGDPITVTWHGAPGNRWDWVGVYAAGADPNVDPYIEWLYTGATIDGSATFDRDAHGAWPLGPGDYNVFLLEDDAYRAVATGAFSVVAS